MESVKGSPGIPGVRWKDRFWAWSENNGQNVKKSNQDLVVEISLGVYSRDWVGDDIEKSGLSL